MLLSIIRSHGADIGTVLMYILSILIIIFLVNPLHECAHGFVAYKLGDRTAKNMGRLTLNPMAHLDYFGAIMMLIVGFGWAKPVPINPRNFKNPKVGMAISALAGPVSNFLAAIAGGLIYNIINTILIKQGDLIYIHGSNCIVHGNYNDDHLYLISNGSRQEISIADDRYPVFYDAVRDEAFYFTCKRDCQYSKK